VLIFWGTFSILYFIFQLIYSKLDQGTAEDKEQGKFFAILIFAAI
jgi:hypothetical protein